MRNKHILFITQTAVFLALLIVFQFLSKNFGQLITGALVNFILITATMLGGFWCGFIIAAVSPFFAFMLGIGTPMLPIVPVIAVGNVVIVGVYAIIKKIKLLPYLKWCIAIIVGAGLKFLALYSGVVMIVLPMLNLPAKQVTAISASFGFMQMVTALIGGVIALLIVPVLKSALHIK